MKTGPFKMKGKSPMMKALIGKQENLPAELKAKIEAAPESPAKKMKVKDMPRKQQMAVKASMAEESPVKMKKAPTKMKKESSMKMKKKSSMKMMKKKQGYPLYQVINQK